LQALPEAYDRRLKACGKLEGAETKLLRTRAKLFLKNKNKEQEQGEEFEVPQNKRPTHKLGFLGLFGEKVDSIEWARKEIAETNEILAHGRTKIDEITQGEGDTSKNPIEEEEAEEAEDEKHPHRHDLAEVSGKIKGVGRGVGKAGAAVGKAGQSSSNFDYLNIQNTDLLFIQAKTSSQSAAAKMMARIRLSAAPSSSSIGKSALISRVKL
jgi:hypothetical protein